MKNGIFQREVQMNKETWLLVDHDEVKTLILKSQSQRNRPYR